MARDPIAHRLLAAVASGLVKGLRMLPLPVVGRIGRAFGQLAWWLDRRHRRVALTNLAAVFGREKTAKELRRIAAENFRRIGESYACGIWVAGRDLAEVADRVEIVGAEKLARRPEESEGDDPPPNRILAVGHFGNFDLLPVVGGLYPDFRLATTYRALHPPALDRVFQSLRERSGCLFIERRRAQFAVSRALRSGGVMLGLLADQSGGERGVRAPFLGVECSTSPAPVLYAIRHRTPLFTALCFRTGLARWRIEVGDEIPVFAKGEPREVEAVVAELNGMFEAAVRRDPANWFWVHNRWKLV